MNVKIIKDIFECLKNVPEKDKFYTVSEICELCSIDMSVIYIRKKINIMTDIGILATSQDKRFNNRPVLVYKSLYYNPIQI